MSIKPKMIIACLSTSFVMSGCSYNAPVSLSAAYDVHTSYEERVPGRWAIWVEGKEFRDSNVKPSTHLCGAHTYPINSSAAFEKSAVKTFSNLVESIQKVSRPIPSSRLADYNFDGQIIVKAEDMDVDLMFRPGFFSSTAEAEVEYEASLTAFIQGEKVLGTTVGAEGEHTGDSGSMCDGGATTIGKAAERGMKKILRQLGERFASSERLRTKIHNSNNKQVNQTKDHVTPSEARQEPTEQSPVLIRLNSRKY